jgi:hypothetical protein
MHHFQTERKAIYEVGSIFTKFNWIFKEQQTVDLGIDAYVETPIDNNGQVKMFALQIKGGDKNFHRKQNSLTFYFTEKHYTYWKAISETFPVLIVIQDAENNVYWNHFSEDNIKKTSKHWKIDIPLENTLVKDKDIILSLAKNTISKTKVPEKKKTLKKQTKVNTPDFQTCCYIKAESKDLYIDLKFKNQILSYNLLYKPGRKNWDATKSFLSWDDPYYYTLSKIIELISSEYFKAKSIKALEQIIFKNVPEINNGIESIMEAFFNRHNQTLGIPLYLDFIEVFKMHSGLKRNQFKVQAIDHVVHFYAKEKNYEIDTYPGLKATLNDYVENDSYDEIYTETEQYIWSEIYIDAGIEKHEFIPILQRKWESYWRELYSRIRKEIGRTNHLDSLKEQSLRELNSFINLYNETPDIIKLAYDFDENCLYPLVVLTMLWIYDSEVCFGEYCEYTFFSSQEWESLCLDDDDVDSEIFFIKELEY